MYNELCYKSTYMIKWGFNEDGAKDNVKEKNNNHTKTRQSLKFAFC